MKGKSIYKKFILVQDSSSHWYVIPWMKRQEWEEWCSLDDATEEAWTPPTWAKEVNGTPQNVVFEKPQIGGYVS